MDLKNFKLLKEDDKSYHVMHPNGKQMAVDKAGLSDKAHTMIKKLRGAQKFADPADAVQDDSASSDDASRDPASSPVSIEINAAPAAPAAPASGFALSPEQQAAVAKYVSPQAPAAPALPANDPVAMAKAQHDQQQAALMKALPPVSAPAPAAAGAPTSMGAGEGVANGMAPMQQNMGEFEKAYRKEQGANTAYANAIGGEGKAETNAIDDFKEDLAALPTQNEIVDSYRQKNQDLMDAYASKKVDPQSYMHNMSTTSKVLTGLALALGGLSTPFTHQANPAIGMLENSINRDIDAQKNAQSQAHSLWSMNREALGTDLAADTATKNQMLVGVKYDLLKAASQFKGPMAQANAQALNAKIDQQIAQNNFKLSWMQGPTRENGGDPSHFVAYSGLIPQEQQKAAFDEIKNATNVTANGKKMLEAFAEAKSQHATDYIPGTENTGQQQLKQLMLPNFKSIDGTVRQAAMDESFNNIIPRFGDSQAKLDGKEMALKNWLASESAAPINAGYGNDLKRYPMTRGVGTAPSMSNVQQQKVQVFMKQNPQVKDPAQAMQILKKAGKL